MLRAAIRHGLSFASVASLFRARALSPGTRDRVFIVCEGKTWTYRDAYLEAVHFANLYESVRLAKVAAGTLTRKDRLALGIYQENSPEFMFAVFGAALVGATVFGLNTGFRGDTLARIVAQADIDLLLTEAAYADRIREILPQVHRLAPQDVLLVDGDDPEGELHSLDAMLNALHVQMGQGFGKRPRRSVDNTAPFMVIYTSGTTGLPKGVACSQFKVAGAGVVVQRRIHLNRRDRGYISMPLFHSNAWFIAVMPLLLVGASMVIRRKFSASAFESDVLDYGVTFMNYVGQPIHYIIVALEKKYGSEEAVAAALANHPQNHLRLAHGNGATPIDRQKMMRFFGMEHIYELYGSTEATITTVVMPGDPQDSVGEVKNRKVVILDENALECAPGSVDSDGRLLNYDAAVGEICRKIGKNNIFFDGYYKNSEASNKKYRNGNYHSGDLGHIRIVDGKRYLYFNGRTDDWIRKDGENFSARNVAEHARELPNVELAIAFGAPAQVADETVMVALKLAEDASFEPQEAFDALMAKQQTGSMDPKWMPDYIRVVRDFDMTETQKIIVRPLKRRHFKLDGEGDVFYRRRGDTTYHALTTEAFDSLRAAFAANGRSHLLE